MQLFIAVYCIGIIIFFICGGVVLIGGYEFHDEDDKKFGARLILASFVWPIASLVWLIQKAW